MPRFSYKDMRTQAKARKRVKTARIQKDAKEKERKKKAKRLIRFDSKKYTMEGENDSKKEKKLTPKRTHSNNNHQ